MADLQWTIGGAYEVGPGVHRIPLPLPQDGLRAVNVYAISDGPQVVLIDSGWALAESRELLASSLDSIGYHLNDVREFLVTHVHRDHYSQAITLRREFGMPVSLGEGERLGVEAIVAAAHGGPPAHTVDYLIRAGAADLAERTKARFQNVPIGEWELPDTWLQAGAELPLRTRTLRAVATPGHTRGHLVFYDDDAGTLFAGDHVLPQITPSIGFEFPPAASPLGDYLASLRLVRSLPDAVLLPAHGPVAPSVHARVDELLDHHEQRLTASAEAAASGADTAWEVARRLPWTRRGRRFDDLDDFNQMLATGETMAHLEVLVARGWLSLTVDEAGVAHYLRT